MARSDQCRSTTPKAGDLAFAAKHRHAATMQVKSPGSRSGGARLAVVVLSLALGPVDMPIEGAVGGCLNTARPSEAAATADSHAQSPQTLSVGLDSRVQDTTRSKQDANELLGLIGPHRQRQTRQARARRRATSSPGYPLEQVHGAQPALMRPVQGHAGVLDDFAKAVLIIFGLSGIPESTCQ